MDCKTREIAMHRDSYTSAALTRPGSAAGWGPWMQEDQDSDGPGLLVSPMFWLGGAASVMLWGCVTLLAIHFT